MLFIESIKYNANNIADLTIKLLPALLFFGLLIHDLVISLYKQRVLYIKLLGITNVIC